MILLSIIRFLAAIVSALILAAAVWLLWTWYAGDWVRDAAGVLHHLREPWRLWTGLGLLAWSFLGRFLVPLIVAKGGGRPSRPERSAGLITEGASGSSLYVEELGPLGAPPIIFTHGWGMDSTFWNYAKADLADRFRLILWDLPGLGKSKPPPGGEISLENFAADLRGLLLTANQPAVLVGHSIGGMTIQTLLRDYPDAQGRIAGVVLLNTTYRNPLNTMVLSRLLLALQKPVIEPCLRLTVLLQPLVWLSKWQSYLSGSAHAALRFGFGKYVTRSQLQHVALLSTRAPPAIEAKGDLAMLNWDATGALATNLRKPLLVIGGDLDIVTKLEASEIMAGETADGDLQAVSGVNHMGPLERADLYNQSIGDFTGLAQARDAIRRPA
jgi:pimeloyl-ACP methyl ester carboxylesterase